MTAATSPPFSSRGRSPLSPARILVAALFWAIAAVGMLVPSSIAFFVARPASVTRQRHRLQRSLPSSSTALYEKKKAVRKKPTGFGGALRDLQSQTFPYAGEVRPGKQSPQRVVLDDDIVKPDYHETGVPVNKNKQLMLPWMIEIKTQEEIERMRVSGRLAREVLDLAGQLAVQPGITTDEIDALVHEETIKVRVCCGQETRV